MRNSKLFKELMIMSRDRPGISLQDSLAIIAKTTAPNKCGDRYVVAALEQARLAGH